MEVLKKANKDRIDLESITKNIEENYKPVNIVLTSYEQEQENNAIISYDELIKNKDKAQVNYDNSYENTSEINIKKVNLESGNGEIAQNTKIDATMMSYEAEEAFLKALKQLQSDLAN